jgi:cytochrome c-type biogenesis protein CcsB
VTPKSPSKAILPATLLIAGVLCGLTTPAQARSLAAAGSLPMEETRGWAVVANGRSKPLQTFANETALRVTGRERLLGFDAMELLWGYVLAPADARTRPFVRVDSLELKAALAVDPGSKRFSMAGLLENAEFRRIVDSGLSARQSGGEPSRIENDALEVHSTLVQLDGLMRGEGLALVPIGGADGGWSSIPQLAGSSEPGRLAVLQAYEQLGAAYAAEDAAAWTSAATVLGTALRDLAPDDYPSAGALSRELFHEDVNAFGKAWKLYLLGFLVLLFLARPERRWGHALAMALLCAGFAFHLLGIGLRWAIAGRAPVSNMYESLVFMGAGAIAFGLIPELILRKRYLGLTAGLVGFLCLAFAENLPIESAISPLVPVLANTYWLSVHVMTIMLSYSAFALAMALGHVLLAVKLFQPGQDERIRTLTGLLDKMLQVGVLFLAAGIACGAVWANESWGRYWGWDPKETWSLITFFVYLAVVHARYAGWIKEFGLAVSAVVSFMAVVMTYYGVNFVLAAGMHSYGFAEGGRIEAAAYVVVEVALLVAAWLRHRSLTAAASPAAA